MVAAESSCNEGSEDSVTFEGNSEDRIKRIKRTSVTVNKDLTTVMFSKNDEPSHPANLTNPSMETSIAMRTMPLPNVDATNDDNETMPLIFSC